MYELLSLGDMNTHLHRKMIPHWNNSINWLHFKREVSLALAPLCWMPLSAITCPLFRLVFLVKSATRTTGRVGFVVIQFHKGGNRITGLVMWQSQTQILVAHVLSTILFCCHVTVCLGWSTFSKSLLNISFPFFLLLFTYVRKSAIA